MASCGKNAEWWWLFASRTFKHALIMSSRSSLRFLLDHNDNFHDDVCSDRLLWRKWGSPLAMKEKIVSHTRKKNKFYSQKRYSRFDWERDRKGLYAWAGILEPKLHRHTHTSSSKKKKVELGSKRIPDWLSEFRTLHSYSAIFDWISFLPPAICTGTVQKNESCVVVWFCLSGHK